MDSPRKAFWNGVRDQSPAAVGILPFAMIVGAATTAAGMDPWLSMGMSLIVYAGASQLAAVALMAQQAPAAIVVLTVLVVNLRFVMYSAAVAPHFAHLPRRKKWMMSYLLTDHNFALLLAKHPVPEKHIRTDSYYLGAAVIMWVAWQVMVAVGIIAGAKVPASWSLDFAIPLIFLALTLPALQTRAHWLTAAVAGIGAVFTAALPLKMGLIAASIGGIVAGTLADLRAERRVAKGKQK